MSFISDIAALAKAGYSVQDVKDLMAIGKVSETPEQKEDNVPPKDEPTPDEKAEPKVEKESDDEDTTDYKAKYEQLLKETQTNNSKFVDIDNSKNETAEETLADFLKGVI